MSLPLTIGTGFIILLQLVAIRNNYAMPSPAEMVKTLRATGHRLTPQREGVLEVIADSAGHITADEILKRVRARYPFLNKSAVYRTLDLLTRLDLITLTDCGRGRVEYELHRHPHHHHVVCRNCGKVQEVEHSAFACLEKRLQALYGFRADLDHFAIFGLCRKCQTKRGKTRFASHGGTR